MIKVSVVVPIYGVEKFIFHCVESLMKQTMQDIEYIFVNDATLDKSMEVLQSVLTSYPERRENVRIIHHDKNKGLPAARNTGLAIATGEYVFHCDSDDYLEANALEEMYLTAKQDNSDIVWCDWFLSYESNERYMKQPSYKTSNEALISMLSGGMKYNVWNKLVRRNLYKENKITFPSGYGMGEDMTMIMLMSYAKNISYLPKAFYHYVKTNTEAFSQTYSKRHLEDLQYNVTRIENFIIEKYGSKLEKELNFFKLEAKFPFLISTKKEKYSLWSSWYPEANKYIWENTNISFRSKFIQICASHRLFWIVRLYNIFVVKIIYGILYK